MFDTTEAAVNAARSPLRVRKQVYDGLQVLDVFCNQLRTLDQSAAPSDMCQLWASSNHKKWSAEAMIQAVLTASMVKDKSKLIDVLRQSISLLQAEGSPCAGLLANIDVTYFGTGTIPSPTSVRLATLVLDGAMMLRQRDRNRVNDISRFFWADSSPQGQFDWLVIQCVAVSDLELRSVNKIWLQLWRDAQSLPSLLQGLLVGGDREEAAKTLVDSSDQQGKMLLTAKRILAFHTFPPVTIGSKAASIEYKVRALLHGLMMESHDDLADTLPRAFENVVSFTTDLGTESALSDVQAADWRQMIPSWQAAALRPSPKLAEPAVEVVGPASGAGDLSLEDALAGILEEDMGLYADTGICGPGVQVQPSPDVDLQSDMGVSVAGMGPGYSGVGHSNSLPGRVGRVAQPAEHSKYVFQKSLIVPGMLHIVGNLLLEVDKSFAGFGKWLAGLKQIGYLLGNKDRRELFVKVCIRDIPEHRHLERWFTANLPETKDWRWRTCVNVLKKLLPMRSALQQAWNLARVQGSAAAGDAGDAEHDNQQNSHADLNYTLLNDTIRSSFWWTYSKMIFALDDSVEELGRWSERCWCHEWARSLSEEETSFLKALLRQFGIDADAVLGVGCPFAGLRAVEMATGRFDFAVFNLIPSCFAGFASQLSV